MQHIQRTMLVATSSETAFQIVNNIKAYKDFLPHCGGSRILESGNNWLNAELKIKTKLMAIKLRTHNVWQTGDWIEISQLSGPFTTLSGRWQFEPLDEARCKVSLDMRFQLKVPLRMAVRTHLVEKVADEITQAFHEQINQHN